MIYTLDIPTLYKLDRVPISTLHDLRLEKISLHNFSGVYILYRDKRIIYIGTTKDFLSRLRCHLKNKETWFDEYSVIYINDIFKRMITELLLIEKFSPPLNKYPQEKKDAL